MKFWFAYHLSLFSSTLLAQQATLYHPEADAEKTSLLQFHKRVKKINCIDPGRRQLVQLVYRIRPLLVKAESFHHFPDQERLHLVT